MPNQVQFRLLVVRLGAMGDILHALPAITALRKAHPAWVIDWAIDPRWAPLLTTEPTQNSSDQDAWRTPAQAEAPDRSGAHNQPQVHSPARPIVDHLHLVRSKVWKRRPLSRQTRAGISALRSQLKAGCYDAVLDLQGSIRSAIVARLSGCHRIIGEAQPREAPARWFYTERVETTGAHVIEQDVELASAVAGDLLTPTTTALPYDPQSEFWCDQQEVLNRAGAAGKPVVVIHPGAGWGAKRWPPDRYGAVAHELARRGAFVLVNVGPNELPLGQSVVDASNGAAIVIESTLSQLIALTRRATVVIGGDSGPLHLANALRRPVVGIYGPTDPQRNGPFGGHFRILRNPESRRDHTRREQTEAGLLTILPQDVIATTLQLLLEVRHESEEHTFSGVKLWGGTQQESAFDSSPVLEAQDIAGHILGIIPLPKPRPPQQKANKPESSSGSQKGTQGKAHA